VELPTIVSPATVVILMKNLDLENLLEIRFFFLRLEVVAVAVSSPKCRAKS
jgi:hypothetical protein